jgi:hypothetical protein
MTKISAFAFGATFLLAGATTSLAQESRPLGLSVRGGLFFGGGENDVALGAELKVKDVNWEGIGQGYAGSISVSLDHFADTTPIMLNFVARNNEWYWTGGAGVMLGDDNAKLGFQVGLGYDFVRGRTPLFLEGKFWAGGGNNGVGVYVGVRL